MAFPRAAVLALFPMLKKIQSTEVPVLKNSVTGEQASPLAPAKLVKAVPTPVTTPEALKFNW
jgi:hypothetical protein